MLCKVSSRFWEYFVCKTNNEYFTIKLERLQYKACIAITGAIQGTSREHLNKKIGLESLSGKI